MLDMVSFLHRERGGDVADDRTDKPDELLESDSKIPPGHNPVMGTESKANK